MFSVQELVTAVELGLPIPIVVVDNGGYAEIRAQQQARGIPPVAVDLRTRTSSRSPARWAPVGSRRSTRRESPRTCAARSPPTDRPSSTCPRGGTTDMDVLVVLVYLVPMIAFGFWGRRRAQSQSDFLVAGRRLGPMLYSGTMAAVVLGGASTIGGVGLGYQYGLSGMWLVVAIGVGILVLSLAFAGRIQRLRVYTVGQMLELRYGPGSSVLSGVVMWAYTLMLAVTSTIAYATIFAALLDLGKVPSILLGGTVVVIYSTLGGMWSITLTDFVQFVIKTVGIFFLLLPIVLSRAGGWAGLQAALPVDAFSLTAIGGGTILTYFVIYTSACSSARTSGSGCSPRAAPASPAGRAPRQASTACSTAWPAR